LDGLNNMRKNALTVLLATLVVSVFGAFLRWLQTKNIFEAETGLPIRGAAISIVCVVYCVLVLAAIIAFARLCVKNYTAATEPAAALRCGTAVPKVLAIVFAVIFVCGALVVLFTAEYSRFPMLQRVFGAFAIFGGLCFPFFPPKRENGGMGTARTASVILTLVCCFWLIFDYRTNAESPVVWEYAPEVLALAMTTLGVFQIAAYYHGRAKPENALRVLLFASFLDISVVFDTRSTALTAMLEAAAGLMLLMTFLLLENLKERGE